jgi:enoyl-CoA hydratase
MAYEDIIVERTGTALEITLNRPEKLNSLREKTAAEIMDAMGEVEMDRTLVGVILQGSEKAFCAGVDTSEFKYADNERFDVYRARKRTRKTLQMMRFVMGYTKPVITVVEGFALGGGLELAMSGDLIVCGEGAQLGLPEVKIGIMPGAGGTQTLPRVVGERRAKEIILAGKPFTAEQAREWGILNRVCTKEELWPAVMETATAIAGNAPLSVRQAKKSIHFGLQMDIRTALRFEIEAYNQLVGTEDRVEGIRSFNEKRRPVFKGR